LHWVTAVALYVQPSQYPYPLGLPQYVEDWQVELEQA
jgi:hypothetical protein